MAGLLAVAGIAPLQAEGVQDTYLDKLEYQDQTLSKESAALLHRQILLQRATQLVTWAMPPGQIYGVVDNAWMQPIKEIGSGKPETLLLVGPGQSYPKDFKGEIVQSDTFLVL